MGCYSVCGFYGKALRSVVREVRDLLVAAGDRNRAFNIEIWGAGGFSLVVGSGFEGSRISMHY